MKIIVGESAGFCFGVKRATKLAFAATEQGHRKICSLGPIIHSPQLVKRLEEHGVEVVRRVEDIQEGAVIIRSHGVTAEEMEKICADHFEVVDATCPFVKKAQEYAGLLSQEDYTLVLVGEREHPEVRGIVSYAREGEVFVVSGRREAEELPVRRKMGVVAQTTQSYENLREVIDVCLGKSQELRVFNTICDATSVRQDEARNIAGRVDLMLVIGGFNSANTTRLAQICREIQPRTHHIETADEIEPTWFAGVNSVGITAGASTPQWIINEVVKKASNAGK
ncbi:MAG: 4-hydroxy-3-methylbut-2-enyl diphosphate reductase [Desulfuromonadaceae bacterium]